MQTDPHETAGHPPAGQILRRLLVLLVVAAATLLAWSANRLPPPLPDTAPDTLFSAERAMQDVRAIAVAPHPIGSAAIEDTRRYLTARMTALGLAPQMRDQTVVVTRRNSADAAIGGRVRNIVGELRGRDPALPAILLMAHYDTAPLSPGAGDDTAGVAAALEIARALKAGGVLRRSVLFLFTDGEEAGLLGANAFFQDDPLRRRVGSVINMEARGDSGRTLMFQTSPGNRALIEAYGRTATVPASDSLMVTIYKRMPNDTDLTAALERGHIGMNFAFVGHQMAYHTPMSTAERLNPRSVQHMGDQILPLLRDFAQAEDLDRSAGDMVFADLFGQYFIAYSASVGWVLAIFAVGGLFAMVGTGIARRAIDGRDVARGLCGGIALLLGIATVLVFAQRLVALLLRDIASPYAVLGQFWWLLSASLLLGFGTGALLVAAVARDRRGLLALAIGVAAAGALAALLGDFSFVPLALGLAAGLSALAAAARPSALPGWLAGAALPVGIAALLFQFFLPNGAHALIWPLLLLLPALALALFAPRRAGSPAALIAAALPAALIAGLMARTGYDFFVMIGAALPVVLAPFILLTVLALLPLIWALRGLGRAGALLVIAGLALCAAAGINGRTPSAASPELVELFHVTDADDGSSLWMSGKLDKSGWVRAALAQDGGKPTLRSIAPLSKDAHWVAKAESTPFVPPRLAVAATPDGKAWRLGVRAGNANGGRYMRLFFRPSVDLTGLRLMERPVPGTLKAGAWSQLIFHASGDEEVHLSLSADRPGTMEVRMAEVLDRPPATESRAPALPPHVVPYRRAGDGVIVTRRTMNW